MKLLIMSGILAAPLIAQTITDPPPILHLIRRAGAATGSPLYPYAAGGVAVNALGMTTITAPAETWIVDTHNSFASIEYVNERVHPGGVNASGDRGEYLSGDVLSDSRNIIAIYRPWLSYRPDQAARMLAKTRYFSVTLYQVRPGAAPDFGEALRTRRDVLDTINLDRPDMSNQVVSGAPSGTYLVFAPLTSLKSLDEGFARRSASVEPRGANKALSSAEINRDQLLFRMQPRISYVSDEFAAESLEFWRR